MRKYHKKQLLDIVQTIKKANILIERFVKNENYNDAIKLLIDCHEGAVNIGNRIEELEGEGTITVIYLEEYCDILYQIGVAINQSKNLKKDLILLHNQIIKIENSITNDIQVDKLEVVFLPYKASMWDSMESVWLAAKDDLQCNTYVVPVPYYDRLQDGGLGKIHYEGDRYPAYVPVEDYKVYNIEARHPDIIFIHNPYDGGNYVTTVHPDYYSQLLRNHTDVLAYIPYFVVADDVPKHFCTCAGVLFADKVFIQSERVRDTYIRVFKEFEKIHNCKGKFGNAESKFIATGSPKLEKIIKSKPEDFTVPDHWKNLIKRPDGTQKRIVLYNTSIGAILQGKNQYIKKLRYVLELFRNREDVVIWWRPHPLSEATYRTMLPQLMREYEQIITDYKNEGWGIYDDTADLHRSIVLSAVYYGDHSSLVTLCQAVRKPIIIQDINLCRHDGEITGLIFDEIFDDDQYFWFSSATYNSLFRMKKDTWELNYMGVFPNEKFNKTHLYKGIVKCGDKLYFAPYAAKEGAIYDIALNSFEKILFSPLECKLKKNRFPLFRNAVSYKQYVYFIPLFYPAIVRLNTENGELEYFDEWLDSINKVINCPERGYFIDYCLNNNELILPCRNTNAVIIFNMENGKSAIHFLGEENNCYACVCFDGNNYWLCTVTGAIFFWDRENNTFTEIVSAVDDDRLKLVYVDMLYVNGYIWAFPYIGDKVIKINVSNNSVITVDDFETELSLEGNNLHLYGESNFIIAAASGDYIYLHTGKNKHFIKYNTLTGEKREEAIIPDRKLLSELRLLYYYGSSIEEDEVKNNTYSELPNINFGINEFLDNYFSSKLSDQTKNAIEQKSRKISNVNINAGQNIYQNCKVTVFGQ